MERPGSTSGQNVTGVPALDAAVKGNQPGRPVGHVADGVLGINLAVMNRLNLQLQHIWHLIRGDQLRAKGEKCGEILHNAQIPGIAADIVVALEDRLLGHVQNSGVAYNGVLPVLFRHIPAVLAHNDAQLRLGGGLLGLLQGGQFNLVIRPDEGIRHLEKAAGKTSGGGGSDVAGVVHIIQADPKDTLGVAV